MELKQAFQYNILEDCRGFNNFFNNWLLVVDWVAVTRKEVVAILIFYIKCNRVL